MLPQSYECWKEQGIKLTDQSKFEVVKDGHL